MSDFFEIFNPGMRHAREQSDLDKVLILEAKKGGTGPEPLDLDSGSVTVVLPGHPGGPDNDALPSAPRSTNQHRP